MNNKDLLNAFFDIDEELIDAARKKPVSKARWFALAACFAVMIATAFTITSLNNKVALIKPAEDQITAATMQTETAAAQPEATTAQAVPETKTENNQTDSVKTFKDKQELFEYINKHKTEVYLYGKGDITAAPMMPEATTAAAAQSNDGVSSDSIDKSYNSSQTYTQEQGVDESDIVKQYKNYLFIVRSSGDIDVHSLNSGKSSKVATVKLPENAGYVNEIYCLEGRLVVVSQEFDYFWVNDASVGSSNTQTTSPAEETKRSKSETHVIIYDISNINNITKTDSFSQSGNVVQTRMIGDIIYTVTSEGIGEQNIPYLKNQGIKEVTCDCIAYLPEKSVSTFVTVSSFNTKTCSMSCEPKSMLTSSEDVYCSADNLYLYCRDYNSDASKTCVTKLALDSLSFVGETEFKGEINSSYSFKEKDGKLFVAVTEEGLHPFSTIISFDEKLNKISQSEKFGVDEYIKAAKYIGNYAYIITYEQTDPLFVIDISDASNIKVLGEAKIDGFSTMLVDVGNNKLLGIGYCTHSGYKMEITDGIKLALFDVSDPLNPVVLDSKEYKKYYSDAQTNPKAFVQDTQNGYCSIAYYVWGEYGQSRLGALVASVENDKIVIKEDFSKKTENIGVDNRVVFVDDWYYLFSAKGCDTEILSFEVR